MTPQQAFSVAVYRGAVPTESIPTVILPRLAWWDDQCELVLLATEALVGLGHPRNGLNLAKCFVAEGYSLIEAAAWATELLAPATPDSLAAARNWLLEQLRSAAA